jgi:hypothetical protein
MYPGWTPGEAKGHGAKPKGNIKKYEVELKITY